LFADLTTEDNGNYTCEIRGSKSDVLASKTFSIIVQGIAYVQPVLHYCTTIETTTVDYFDTSYNIVYYGDHCIS